MTPTPPKLRVFCPVNPSDLVLTAQGAFCRKCQQHLADATDLSKKSSGGGCGIVRRMAAPVIGSSLFVAGCASPPEPTGICPPSPPSQIAVPGMYLPPQGLDLTPENYPLARQTDEPGIVISPYTDSKVDVSQADKGSLVLDPAYRMEDRKFFRVPDAN